jgi:N-acetylneuraminic acid mutarotase
LLSTGKVLVAGGDGSGTASAELYDPVANSWSPAGNLITDRYYYTATLLPNGKVLAVGGYQAGVSPPRMLMSAELYDPVTNTWAAASAMTYPREGHTATLLQDGTVLVVGGSTPEVYWLH